ncbi:MAG: Nif11-like leader peptide family natural product precursor [Desulfobacterium sp.]|nr:Nif11-like leader peptide family natural product precursor [Desulfobacterium sp.]
MTVHDAKTFITGIQENQDLRKGLNRCKSSEEIKTLLGENGYKFNAAEFVEAWSSQVATSQTKECHDAFNEIRMWWELLNRF